MKACRIEDNKKNCPCTYEPCVRKGLCCDCLQYHRNNGELPACFFPPDIEKKYDRTIEKFIEIYQKRGRAW